MKALLNGIGIANAWAARAPASVAKNVGRKILLPRTAVLSHQKILYHSDVDVGLVNIDLQMNNQPCYLAKTNQMVDYCTIIYSARTLTSVQTE